MIAFAVLILLQAKAPDPFSGDERLDKLISYSTYTTSVARVLDHVKGVTGVELRAQPSIAEDLIVLRIKDRPAHEVLSKIASHFDWVWTKNDGGYTLAGKPGWEAKERQELENFVFQTMNSGVESAREYLRSATGVDRTTALARIEAIKKQIQAIEEANAEKDEYDSATFKQLRDLEREREKLRSSMCPGKHLVAEIVTSLGRATLLEMAKRGRLVFSVRPTVAQRGMPARAVAAAEALVREVILTSQRYRAREDASDSEMALVNPGRVAFSPEDVATVRVAISASWPGIVSDEYWEAYGDLAILGKSGKVLWSDSQGIGNVGHALDELDYERPYETDDETEKREPSGPSDMLPQKLTEYPELREAIARASSAEMPSPLLMASFVKASHVDPLSAVNQVAVLAAEGANCSLIADAYDTIPLLAYGGVWGGETLGEVIDSFVSWRDAKWQYEGGWIAVRSVNPAVGRASTVPRPVFRKYRDLMADQLGLTEDQSSEMALDLTDLQLRAGGLEMLRSTLDTFHGLGPNALDSVAYAYRAWASLGPERRAALRSGSQIPYGALPPAAREHLTEFLYRRGDDWDRGDYTVSDFFDGFFGSDEIEGAEEGEMQLPDFDEEIDENYDGAEDREITQILPNGPSPDSFLSLESVSAPAVSTKISFGGMEFPLTFPASLFGELKLLWEGGFGPEYPTPAISFEGFRPASANGLILSFTFLPDKSAKERFVGMTAIPGTEFGQMDSLPKEIKEVIEKAYARAKKRFERYRDLGDGGGGTPRRATN